MAARNRQSGFSLIELISVVVLLGILATGAGLLITRPIEAYDAQVRRQQLVDQGEMALRQIAREVRRALPNSLRLATAGSVVAVELVPTLDGARYRDETGGEFTSDFDTLEFSGADSDFNLLGDLAAFAPGDTLSGTQRLVIYNTSAVAPGNIYASVVADANPGIVTTSGTAVGISLNTPLTQDSEFHISLAPAFQFSQQSPGQRIFVIDQPISYICNPGTGRITRNTGYGYLASQSTAPGGSAVDPVISQLGGCGMSYSPGTAQRGGVLTLEITIADGSENLTLLHQIHVVNVP